jgi:hypothetical protein
MMATIKYNKNTIFGCATRVAAPEDHNFIGQQ